MALFVCTQPPLTTSIVSFVNNGANCGFPSVAVGSFKPTPPLTAAMASSGHLASRIKWLTPIVTSMSLMIKASGLPAGGNDETTGVDFANIFRIKDKDELSFDSVFTGEVEKQYLEYIAKLDFQPFHDHVRKFPRKRSEAEKKAIFDRYVEVYDRQYVTEELKSKRYGYFKGTLDWIDEHNAKNPNFTYGIAVTDDLIPCDERPPQSYTSSSFPPGEAGNSIYFRPGRGVGLFSAHHWDSLIGDMDFEEFCKSKRSKI